MTLDAKLDLLSPSRKVKLLGHNQNRGLTMDLVLQIIAWATANGPQFVSALVAFLSALISVCLLIPGEQPEKFLQGIVDFLAKFSKK